MRPPISASAGLARRSVGPCGASACSTPATEGRVKCYQKWAVGPRLAGVHDAEAIALRIGQDDVVRVRRSLVPMDLGGTQRQQALNFSRLILRVQVKVDARGQLDRRANLVEREIWPDTVPRV